MNKKRITALFLALMMVLALPVQSFAQDVTDFTFQADTGTITKYTGTARDIVIPDAIQEIPVKAIGAGVFGRKNLTSVQLPGTLEEIGQNAFFNNPISDIVFPESLRSIGDRAFANNTALTQITFAEGLEKIGPRAFQNDAALSGVVELPDTLREVGRLAFDNTKLTQLHLQGGESTAPIVFKDQALSKTGITVWNLPQHRDILIYYNVMGDSVTEPVQLHGGEIVIPAGASQEEIRATVAASYLLYSGFSVIYNADPSGASDRIVRTPVEWNIPSDIDNTAGAVAAITGTFENIPAENYQVETGYSVVAQDTVESLIGYLTPAITLRFENVGEEPATDWTAEDFTYAHMEDKRVSTHSYYGITGFSKQGREKLAVNKELILPNTDPEGAIVQGIGTRAFSGLSLQSVQLPMPSNTEFLIGASAFSDNQLTEIDIPDGVRVIDTDAFARNRIQSVDIPGSVLIVGNSAFQRNEIRQLTISDDVRRIQIDNYSFANNKLTSVNLPYSLMKIREYVFANNTGMEPIPDTEQIPGDEHYGVVHLYTRNPLHLHTSTYIYGSRYQKIMLVSEVDREPLFAQIGIAKNLSEDDYTEESWTELHIVLAIAREVFEDPEATSATITQATRNLETAIGNLEPVSVNKKALAALLAKAQAMNPEMYTDESYETLAVSMAQATTVLAGTLSAQADVDAAQQALQAAIDQLVISDAAGYKTEDFTFSGTTVTGFSPSGQEKRTINKHLVLPEQNPEGEAITAIGSDAFAMKDNEVFWGTDLVESPNGLWSVVIPDTVKRIENRAFRLNALTEIQFPQGLEFIGMQAFNGNQLTTLVLPDSVTELGAGVFSLNPLTRLTLSKGLTEIANGAFSRNIYLTKVEIPEGVAVVRQAAFMGSPLKELVIPSTVHTIERQAFSSHRLDHPVIPGTVKNIERNAFENNVKYRYMRELTLEEGIETIGNNAFKSGLLQEVYLPGSLTSLSATAFNDNLDENKQPLVVKLYTTNPDHLAFPASKHHIVILLHPKASFDANGGRVRRGAQTEWTTDDGRIILPDRSELGLARPGYVFEGWRAEESGETLLPGTSYTLRKDTVFAAVWRPVKTDTEQTEDPATEDPATEDPTTETPGTEPDKTVVYAYDAHGGRVRRGTKMTGSVPAGTGITLPTRSEMGLARPGYRFIGWRVKDGGETLEPGALFILNTGTVFEAVWEKL